MAKSVRQDTKDTVRREALRLFARKSYSAVSMKEIAKAVGVQASAIYNHFPSKQAILADLMSLHLETLLSALDTAMHGISGTRERLEAFSRFHVSHHIDYPDDVFIAYMELRSLSGDELRLIEGQRDRYERYLRQILQDGMDENLFRISDAAVHARLLLAMLTGVTVWYREGGRLDRESVVDIYVRAAMQSVGLTYP